MTITADTLDTFLGLGGQVDSDRATLIIGLVTAIAQATVNPLPDGSDAVILSATVRAYTNPEGVTSETAGPINVTRTVSSCWLEDEEIALLRRLAGRGGGAFSINPAANAGVYGDPLAGIAAQDEEEYLEETGQ